VPVREYKVINEVYSYVAGYNSCLIDSDNVLAGKLKSVAIDRSRVLFSTVIKQGSYGVFCCGTFLHVSRHGDETDDEHRPERQSQLGEEVFVKAITSTASVWDIQQFLISASSLIVSQHRNVLHVLGISSIKSGPPIVVYPLMPDGHILKDLLVKRRETDAAGAPLHPLSVPQLVFITAQVARGVNHLARNKLIHKDIAARNCLVTSRLHVRVMDGSLGIDLFPSEYDSIDQTRCRYPIRWMAAECLGGRPATIESDVWSFGVAMWEIMTHGDIPYANMVVERLLTVLQEGRRLEQPSSCPNQVYVKLLFVLVDIIEDVSLTGFP
jgi:RYK receptor-like tyrosine kinase